MTLSLLHGNALALPLADRSVHLVCTSPPYFSLRAYSDGGETYDGQLGSETTPLHFLAALWAVMDECWRVLRDDGSCWVNLGDKFSGSGGHNNATLSGPSAKSTLLGSRANRTGTEQATRRTAPDRYNQNAGGLRAKSRMLLPHRFAEGLIDPDYRQWTEHRAGLTPTATPPQWICRMDAVWSKCLSGGTNVYARINGREKVLMVKDLARCPLGTAELWTGEKWSPMLRCDPTPPTDGRTASSIAARSARYRGKPIPPLVSDLEVELRNGERIGCTPNHKWPTMYRGVVRADELIVGDVLPIVRLPSGSAAPAGLDDEMTGWLVGLYIAEGSRSEDMVQIASHAKETERFDRLKEIAEAFDGRFALHHMHGNAVTANLSGKIIRAILDTYVGGCTAKDKRLAPICWRRSDVFIRAVLDGYLSGDGGYDVKLDRWSLGFTANDGLASDLRTMAARLGYSVRLRRFKHKFDGREFPGWLGTLYTDPARRQRPDAEIVAIRQSRARQFWNIEIADEPHEFALASGVLTENSNGLPESVTDRVRASHEYWFHLVKSERYYAALDEIREEQVDPSRSGTFNGAARTGRTDGVSRDRAWQAGVLDFNPLGKLPGSVWTVTTEPLTVPPHLPQHFAAFPSYFPRRIIAGWSPSGVCTVCGEGRRPVCETDEPVRHGWAQEQQRNRAARINGGVGRVNLGIPAADRNRSITGYACACPTPTAPTTPARILDPFSGTGTTAIVADALGRHGVGVDLSWDYHRIARWRFGDGGLRAKAVGVEKPAKELEGQLSLLGEAG